MSEAACGLSRYRSSAARCLIFVSLSRVSAVGGPPFLSRLGVPARREETSAPGGSLRGLNVHAPPSLVCACFRLIERSIGTRHLFMVPRDIVVQLFIHRIRRKPAVPISPEQYCSGSQLPCRRRISSHLPLVAGGCCVAGELWTIRSPKAVIDEIHRRSAATHSAFPAVFGTPCVHCARRRCYGQI